ncbi:RNA repair domain-containing protein [Streptomyces sp. NBC_00249]|uniref:poly(A) polymerase n=1 Tax=Streptomyces sp. NBC_00249 TaxID=2975690 RepID=UPI00224D4C12|nr:poly(A) polymerase [Streptomyces sp. NBC_00249]MCX5195154.1 RNA repair domain-containing protein [Streptomyces sp. NBC_00249]
MRTSEQLYHQVRWDPRFDPARFTLGLLQRGAAPKRVPLPSFVPGGDIPWHRVLFVEADGELVWDRATGVDLIDTSPAGRVREERLLRTPFFTARTPHAWDPADGGAWRPVRAGSPAAPPERVRLLTWNTLWDRYDAPLISTALRRPMLVAELATADADVIALQEVERPLLSLLLAAPWVRDGYTLYTDPAAPDVSDCGLVILSRLPVRESGLHMLGRHKAVVAVTVDTAAGPLVVAGTHLSSDHTENGAAVRETQLARIAEGLSGVDAAVALLGDFNDGRSGAAGPAAALGLRDAWNEAHGDGDDTPTFDPGANPLAAVGSLTGRAARLDRILLGPGGAARVREAALRGDAPGPDGLFPSDHFGVEATVEYGAPGAAPALLDVAATARTAVAWLPPDDPAVDALRRAHDPQVRRWPAHVNLLFGFVPESSFPQALPLLAQTAAETEPFTARLEGVHTFGHREDATLWLDPAAGEDGDARWQRLRQALADRFPGCGGRAGGWTPHLTLGRSPDPLRAEREFTARLGGGRSARVGSLAVLSRRGDGPMRIRAVVHLGTGESHWAPEPAPRPHWTPAPDPAPAAGPGAGPAIGTLTDPEAGPGAVPFPRQEPDPVAGPEPGAVAQWVVGQIAGALGEGVVLPVGSRRMGCALPGADLDLVAVLPGTADLAGVRQRVAAALPAAERLREVTGARVPGLRMSVAGLDVDLVVVAAGVLDPAHAPARRAELGEAAAVALSALADADAVRDSVGGAAHAAFARLAREVKAWARARGLDSAPFGGLPGLAWAVLAARTVREAADLSPGPLRRAFFATWAAWDWAEPVALTDPADPADAAGAVTVLTPAEPVRSCTAQVGGGMRDLLVRELYRAWELLEDDPDDLGRVLLGPPLHRRHAAWAVVTVRGDVPREFEENLGRARGRLRALLGALAEAGVEDAHAWPRPFERTDTGARYAVGLGATPPPAARLAALTAPWSAGLPGVEVAWAACGEVPDLVWTSERAASGDGRGAGPRARSGR